jgi:hypothetical protein
MFHGLSKFAACAEHQFFGLDPWYHYLNATGRMEIDASGGCSIVNGFTFPGDAALVALAFLDIALRLAAFVAIAFVIYGGIQFVTSQGEPEASKHARQTIINAVIGLLIALFATALVAFVGTRLV